MRVVSTTDGAALVEGGGGGVYVVVTRGVDVVRSELDTMYLYS